MSYLRCGRCGLQIRVQAEYLSIDNCPRCLARSALVSPLVRSAKWVSPAAGWGGTTLDPDADPRTAGEVVA
jgi:hypothetical protein